MGEWLQSLPVVWMALVVFTLTYLAAFAIFLLIRLLARGGRTHMLKGVSPGMLPPLGIIFGLLVAFVASQVWNDMDHAKAAVNHEASELSTVLFLAASFPGDTETSLRDLTRRHIEDAVGYEWPMMAEQSASLAVTPVALAEELQLILTVVPHSEGQATAQREIVTALEGAIEARRQRIVVSRSSVNWVKWTALILQAICTLVAIAMIHSDNRGAATAAMGIFATGVAVSILLIASYDRPFTGEISVKPDLLMQIMPEEAIAQHSVDHTVLLHLTGLLRSAEQVGHNRPAHLSGKELIEQVRAKHPVPELDATSAEGRMIQAELDAMREVADEGASTEDFAAQVAERFNRKMAQTAYLKVTARNQANAPDAWEDHAIGSGEPAEQEAPLNGRKAWRMLIPEDGKIISAAIYLK